MLPIFLFLGLAAVWAILGIGTAVYVFQLGAFLVPGLLLAATFLAAAFFCGRIATFLRQPAEDRRRFFGRFVLASAAFDLCAVLTFVSFLLSTSRYQVEGVSMVPTWSQGTHLVVDEWAYRFSQRPERGDVVIYQYPPGAGRFYLKRVLGLPDEQIRILNGRLFINGVGVDEPYLAAPPSYSGEWLVAPETYFVLGDNRNNSHDSHNYGSLPAASILGRVAWVVQPFWGPVPAEPPTAGESNAGR